MDANGSGYVSDVVAGLNYVIANKSKFNIRVVNMSLGHPVYESTKTDPLCLAVEKRGRRVSWLSAREATADAAILSLQTARITAATARRTAPFSRPETVPMP
jgi:subtilisin family serine protease